MKANEVLSVINHNDYFFHTNEFPKGSHVSLFCVIGRIFPTTKEQAKKFQHFDVLNNKDVEKIEAFLNKHGFEGNYKLTKSKTWCRLENTSDFVSALKKEFGI